GREVGSQLLDHDPGAHVIRAAVVVNEDVEVAYATRAVQVDGVGDGDERSFGCGAFGDRVSGLALPSVLVPHHEGAAGGTVDDVWPEHDSGLAIRRRQRNAFVFP